MAGQGSAAFVKMMGIVRVSRWTAKVAGVELARMMSGFRPTNSFASARIRLGEGERVYRVIEPQAA